MEINSPLDLDKFTIAWIIWLAWFLFWETWALIERNTGAVPIEKETFSDHIWFLRNLDNSFITFMLTAFLLWLVYHFLVEGR